jgi:hypothetical protein
MGKGVEYRVRYCEAIPSLLGLGKEWWDRVRDCEAIPSLGVILMFLYLVLTFNLIIKCFVCTFL